MQAKMPAFQLQRSSISQCVRPAGRKKKGGLKPAWRKGKYLQSPATPAVASVFGLML
jgi:hypothetical protein